MRRPMLCLPGEEGASDEPREDAEDDCTEYL